MYDVIVIGAGPAGLQAALTLGRMHRSTLILDSGEYRNGPVSHMHNVLADDGTSPAEYRARAREQLKSYAQIELRDGIAVEVNGSRHDFSVSLASGGIERARHIIIATGVSDDLPTVSGLDELWGRAAFACPFCDGHEFTDRELAVLGSGARAEHLVRMLRHLTNRITVFPIEGADPDEQRAELESLGVTVSPHPVRSVSATPTGVSIAAGGTTFDAAGIFVAAGAIRQRAPFAEQLGLHLLPSGAIEIDDFGRTSRPGVSAAGDLAHRASLPGVMASVIHAAAAGQMAAAAIVQELSATEAQTAPTSTAPPVAAGSA